MTGRGEGALRVLLAAWVHLAVLWTFALVQPLFGVLADAPEFFVARGNTRGDIVLFAVGVVVLPPTLLTAVEAVALVVGRGVRRIVHLAFMALGFGAFALTLLHNLDGADGWLPVAVALAIGAAGAYAYERTDAVPAILTVLGPAPLVFLVLFLGFSRVSDLVFPTDVADAFSDRPAGDSSVVFVIFDELPGGSLLGRDGRVDPVRYPNFAALAEDATWYRYASTVSNNTERAVPALLTGTMPREGDLPTASDHPGSLFTLLGDHFSLDVSEPVTDICPTRLCGDEARPPRETRLESLVSDLSVVSLHQLLPPALAEDLPAVDRSFSDFATGGRDAPATDGDGDTPVGFRLVGDFGDRPRAFGRFLRGIGRPGDRPALNFLHLGLPHIPWQYLPSGQQYTPPVTDPPGLSIVDRWTREPLLPAQAYQRYVLQLEYVDGLLGRLLRRLRATGRYDSSMLVVASDHGEGFRPGYGRRMLMRENAAEIGSIALFMKAPGQRDGKVEDGPMRSIDVVPTLADLIGMSVPWQTDGRSVADGFGDGPATVRVVGGGGEQSLSFATFREERDRTVSRYLSLVGAGRANLYGLGVPPRMYRRPEAALAGAIAGHPEVELDGPEQLGSVHPRSAVLPAFVGGRISSGAEPGDTLGLFVNGRLEAMTRAWDDNDVIRFGAMVRPDALRRGPNRVRMALLAGDPITVGG